MLNYFAVQGEFTGFPALLIIMLLLGTVTGIFVLFAAPFFIMTALLRRRAEAYLKTRDTSIITQYDAPYGLTPAQIGFLYDLNCGDKEIRATLFDLEQRKFVVFDGPEKVRITNTGLFPELEEYEKIALRMYASNISEAELSEVLKMNVQYQAASHEYSIALPPKKFKSQFTAAVQKSLTKKGLYTKGYTQSFVQRVLLFGFIIGLWPLITAAFPIESDGVKHAAWSSESFVSALGFTFVIGFIIWPSYYLLSYLLLKLYTKIAGRSWLSNKRVRAIWPELEGYRLFLKAVDLDNIQFESQDVNSGIITKTLPYAMVFNMETKWQKRLKK